LGETDGAVKRSIISVVGLPERRRRIGGEPDGEAGGLSGSTGAQRADDEAGGVPMAVVDDGIAGGRPGATEAQALA
jgi:hypothetical protein